eukprot:CAMPEP_0117545192 /NCGR_PEP_ID=MMETSP0784-20121206/45968_1 /TAXON_ID=39447 /ORGANISM="" /LENGTH=621 /DNA_ID=CAMNT_0005342031 /DNA_START=77 /DNA_END=1939 /DNA_ORIENTATION=-
MARPPTGGPAPLPGGAGVGGASGQLRKGPNETKDARYKSTADGYGRAADVEDYALQLETRLAMKSALLDEALRLHRSLEARLASLEEGLSWKDAQLDAVARQSEEACRDRVVWRERSERLEEENILLRDALLERADENEQILKLLEVQTQQHQGTPRRPSGIGVNALNDSQGASQVRHLTQQLKESNQKNLLLEEQLRIRSGSDDPASKFPAPELNDELYGLGALWPEDAWAVVGRTAADRLCGVAPHMHGCYSSSGRGSSGSAGDGSLRRLGRRGGGENVATGGRLPDSDSEEFTDTTSPLSQRESPTANASALVLQRTPITTPCELAKAAKAAAAEFRQENGATVLRKFPGPQANLTLPVAAAKASTPGTSSPATKVVPPPPVRPKPSMVTPPSGQAAAAVAAVQSALLAKPQATPAQPSMSPGTAVGLGDRMSQSQAPLVPATSAANWPVTSSMGMAGGGHLGNVVAFRLDTPPPAAAGEQPHGAEVHRRRDKRATTQLPAAGSSQPFYAIQSPQRSATPGCPAGCPPASQPGPPSHMQPGAFPKVYQGGATAPLPGTWSMELPPASQPPSAAYSSSMAHPQRAPSGVSPAPVQARDHQAVGSLPSTMQLPAAVEFAA